MTVITVTVISFTPVINDLFLYLGTVNTEKKNNKWVTTIKEWITKLGIGHLNFNTNNSKFYINSIQQGIQDQAKQNMNSLINVGEKLKFFEKFIKVVKDPHTLISVN